MSHRVTERPVWDLDRHAWKDLPVGTKVFLCSYIQDEASENLESHVKRIAKAGSPVYEEIISHLKMSSIMLDLGCGFGQDIRRLVYDGAPAENIFGLDKEEEFIELGFDLFRDRATLKSTFLVDDFLKPSAKLVQLAGHIHIINSGYFLHLWDWNGQVDRLELRNA
nr:hypothetical protein ANI_1_1890104 [Aspergillus niger CBS 513.88]|eukprot:XP_001395631.2 hypothetical protein ANI_1_1890104 [Aspergillus niger CBS 513.88]